MNVLDAYAIASELHRGKTDLLGRPYIEHLSRVFARVHDAGGSRSQQLAALLHDSIEDGVASREGLLERGFDAETVNIVVVLTHKPHEPYVDYLERIAAYPAAVMVKIADVLDNSDSQRMLDLAGFDPDKAERLNKKYERALSFLQKRLTVQRVCAYTEDESTKEPAP